MSFKEELQKLSSQIKERKDYIINEEMTKQALIIPFIQILGFDVFNPLEVRPEYIADFGKKRGEKVDYALFKENEPIIFIEAKVVGENLNNHDGQLSRYFNSTSEVKLAILTNGIEYKFFTDLNNNNIMDENPFLTVNLLNLKDIDIENIANLQKNSFDKNSLITYAEELVYTNALNKTLKELFKNPNDEFIRFIIKDFSDMRITSNVIDRFRPLVKKAISNAVLDIVSKGLYQEEKGKKDEIREVEGLEDNVETIPCEKDSQRKKIIKTTEEEIKAYEFIKDILVEYDRNIEFIGYKDTTNYFSIYLKNTTRWIVRLNLDANTKNIMFKLPLDKIKEEFPNIKVEIAPKGIGESRLYIESIEDLNEIKELIVQAYDLVNF